MDEEEDVYERIKDELDCPICKEIFTHPKSLSCGHTFCCACLKKVVKTLGYLDFLKCPTCRKSTMLSSDKGVEGLTNNFNLASLVEMVKEDKQKAPPSTAFQQNVTATVACNIHGRPMDLFCQDCDTGSCTLCLVEVHKNHSFTAMDEKITEWTATLKTAIPVSNSLLESATSAADSVKEEKRILNEQKAKVLHDVASYYSDVHEAVTEREKLLFETVSRYYELKLNQVDDVLIPIEMQSNALAKDLVDVRHMTVSTTTPFTLLKKMVGSVKKQNTEFEKLVEKAGKLHLSGNFLTFVPDKSVLSLIMETGQLNECATVEEGGLVGASKVKNRLLIRQGTTRLHFESNTSDSEEEIDVGVTGIDENENEDAIYDEVVPPPVFYEQMKPNQQKLLDLPPIPPVRERPSSPNPYQKEYVPYCNYPRDSAPVGSSQILKPVREFPLNHAVGQLKNTVQPWGIAVAPSNDVYVTDVGNHCVLVITPGGHLSRLIGTKGNGRGQFIMPVDVALDEKGNVYVADRQNGTVQKFTPNGRIKTRFKQQEQPNDFKQPNGLTIFQNKVYMSDRSSSKIFIFDQQGSFLSVISMMVSIGDNPFQPSGIAVHFKFEKIYVADRCNHKILVFNNEGDFVCSIGEKGREPGQLLFPNGVSITSNDLLLVTETENNRVSVFNAHSGKFLKAFGETGEQEGMFIIPRHLTVNRYDEVYVADEKNGRVQVFNVCEDPSYIEINVDGRQLYA